jgi:hypothetical protein
LAARSHYGGEPINARGQGGHRLLLLLPLLLSSRRGAAAGSLTLLHYNPSQAYVVAVESYAHEMQKDERAFRGYYYWQVLYQTTKGTFLLPVGYPRNPPKRVPGSEPPRVVSWGFLRTQSS